MLIRTENGKLVEIKITDFLTDADYYNKIIKLGEIPTPPINIKD